MCCEYKILYVLDTLSCGSGVASVVLTYWRLLGQLQKEPDPCIRIDFMINEEPSEGIRQELKKAGSEFFLMPPLQLKRLGDYQKELTRFFENHTDYDIIHGHVPNAAFFYMRAAGKAGVPVRILHSHNSRGADRLWKRVRNRILSKAAMRYVNEYMACGEKAARYLFGRPDCFLIKNVVDPDRFQYRERVRASVRKRLGMEKKLVIGHIGRFCPQKNQGFLIRVFASVCRREPDSCLLLLGEGKDRKKAQQLTEELGLTEKVYFCGNTERVEDYLQAMDVFVLPSRYEGVPVAAVEAMATGLPCILSSAVTGEIRTEAVTYMSRKDSREQWAEQILEWGRAGRCGHLPASYEAEKAAEYLLGIYHALL